MIFWRYEVLFYLLEIKIKRIDVGLLREDAFLLNDIYRIINFVIWEKVFLYFRFSEMGKFVFVVIYGSMWMMDFKEFVI